jgi:tetratricopeptide (TPR) repeat protein
MSALDFRDCAISGATPAALDAFEEALASFQSWRSGTEEQLSTALRAAPAFVMARVLEAHLLVSSRDPARVRAARPVLAEAAALPANPRERLHLAAIAAVLSDDYDRAKALLGELLRAHPRDVLALQAAHALDYVTGDGARMADRVSAVLPAWSPDLPGYHAVLAMHAFGLVESGHYPHADRVARKALDLDPFDARARHVLAHVFEMTERADAGLDWMYRNVEYWSVDTVVATHCWWHAALFHLSEGEVDAALSLYDLRVRAGRSPAVADIIDAASLLWRIELSGGHTASRWRELADAWAPHIGDRFCSFNDLHAMIAFVGAREWDRAQRLEHELEQCCLQGSRYGETTRQVGLAACRGVLAFGRGDYHRAIDLLSRLPELAHRIGGSQAQRDVLHFTLSRATARVRPRIAARRARAESRETNETSAILQ